MLVITGSGRCGTSVLARFCHNVGFVTGGSWNHEVNAGMEDGEFVSVSEAIIAGNITEQVERYISRFPRLVVKDPRFIRPQVVRFWAERRPDLRLLICVRDMEHVAKSFSKSNLDDDSHLKWATERTHEMMLAYVEIANRQIPVRFLAFPNFLDDFATVHRLLNWGGLPINYEIGKRSWDALINHEMVHYK